jgi:hypothetical protein
MSCFTAAHFIRPAAREVPSADDRPPCSSRAADVPAGFLRASVADTPAVMVVWYARACPPILKTKRLGFGTASRGCELSFDLRRTCAPKLACGSLSLTPRSG